MLKTSTISFPTESERQRYIMMCHNEISHCDAAMQHLQCKAAVDALLSQMTQPYMR